ncbi:ATP-binding cassette domain-containing protein [Nocardiopsis ansamitocini]|uniref:Daunorubicin resistance protein DrrA family ABC transporter ATP-binding protein n=1 Tax=Nocardiopsis ansamitocini TaxID=1670832 RepID=A0A9W6ULQ7_9ACTN|nr:ATP-binding cassette domain-containing protein [Nocardiopsis ansamitocini]GLU50315.1 daunorubicin resistance protein DrrA family ABC transporter ATP-binding protein [Nocardiopsis ansamitocini]
MGHPAHVIEVDGLTKSFGAHRALKGIDLHVPRGHVLGLLGPNGAGKTTTVRILTTLLRPDAGRVMVAGHDVVRDPAAVRRRIGLSGQFAAVDEKLTGYENLRMVARLYGMTRRRAAQRARELLERFRLADVGDQRAGAYSGGMRRRLDLAGALVAEPDVVVLDEPTTGLDPRGRLDTWEVVGELVADGTTVLLTTQYLEEADQLAHSIAVIDQGVVIARGTADELKARVGGGRMDFVVADAADVPAAAGLIARSGAAEPVVDATARRISIAASGGHAALTDALGALERDGIQVLDAALRRPTLDDVFLELTGHAAREPGPAPALAGAGGTA